MRASCASTSTPRALPGVLGAYCGADCEADGLAPLQHQPVPSTRFDMKMRRA